ncbi:response regulator [Pararhizobium mangrovi]|uniref:Response regulator n=1 Tax=Pararhizobium mangrovi TaxID=2590452 RepID=A0A506U6B2_9HYPH|nr:response regulator [Pararhizobium mangrovi]TPW29028.1 response regulator [Pararhizobium mangrovi]
MSIKDKLKILVAEDHTTSRMLINESLHELGIKQIVFAVDGEEALRKMMNSPCNIVISDLYMPKLNGLKLLKALRDYKPTAKVPFIVLTGKEDKEVLRTASSLGANNYLMKPISTPVLKQSLEAVVGKL